MGIVAVMLTIGAVGGATFRVPQNDAQVAVEKNVSISRAEKVIASQEIYEQPICEKFLPNLPKNATAEITSHKLNPSDVVAETPAFLTAQVTKYAQAYTPPTMTSAINSPFFAPLNLAKENDLLPPLETNLTTTKTSESSTPSPINGSIFASENWDEFATPIASTIAPKKELAETKSSEAAFPISPPQEFSAPPKPAPFVAATVKREIEDVALVPLASLKTSAATPANSAANSRRAGGLVPVELLQTFPQKSLGNVASNNSDADEKETRVPIRHLPIR